MLTKESTRTARAYMRELYSVRSDLRDTISQMLFNKHVDDISSPETDAKLKELVATYRNLDALLVSLNLTLSDIEAMVEDGNQ